MLKFVKATTLRDHLADVLKEVSKGEDHFIVTKKGRPHIRSGKSGFL